MQRNLTAALPGMIDAVRAAPRPLGAEFKLYRNLNVLYDVFASLTEATGAFGPKSDYEALGQRLEAIDIVRRHLGDTLEQLTSATQSEVIRLRTQVHTYIRGQKPRRQCLPRRLWSTTPSRQRRPCTRRSRQLPAAPRRMLKSPDAKTKDTTGAGTSAPPPKP